MALLIVWFIGLCLFIIGLGLVVWMRERDKEIKQRGLYHGKPPSNRQMRRYYDKQNMS